MLRRVLLCSAVALGTVIVSAPSASAEQICVAVSVHGTVNYSTGNICRYEYPLGTLCGSQDHEVQRPPLVVEYTACLPSPMAPAESETP